MTNKQLTKQLTAMGACKDAIEWVGERDLKTAWAECERADWMLWLAGNMAIECGRLSLRFTGTYRAQLEGVYRAAETCAENPTDENRAAAEAAWAAEHETMCEIIRRRLTIPCMEGVFK